MVKSKSWNFPSNSNISVISVSDCIIFLKDGKRKNDKVSFRRGYWRMRQPRATHRNRFKTTSAQSKAHRNPKQNLMTAGQLLNVSWEASKDTSWTLVKMAFLLKRLCLQPSTRKNVLLQTRNLILVPQDDNRPVKTITEVIDELSMSVIGGPTSYDPEEYNKRRQDL